MGKKDSQSSTQLLGRLLALVLVAAAIAQLLGCVRSIETNTIYLLVLALAAIILPDITELSVGKDGVTLKRIAEVEKKAAELQLKTERATRSNVELATALETGVGGKGQTVRVRSGARIASARVSTGDRGHGESEDARKPTLGDQDDPEKGKWGGQAEFNGRRLQARVARAAVRPDWFDVTLIVDSTDPSRPLKGLVHFHLHPSFRPIPPIDAASGVAQLRLICWGAFTVGAEADEGLTKLELDLAEVEDAPSEFRES